MKIKNLFINDDNFEELKRKKILNDSSVIIFRPKKHANKYILGTKWYKVTMDIKIYRGGK